MTSDILNIDAELEDRRNTTVREEVSHADPELEDHYVLEGRHNKAVREEVQQHRTVRCSAQWEMSSTEQRGMSSAEQRDAVHDEEWAAQNSAV